MQQTIEQLVTYKESRYFVVFTFKRIRKILAFRVQLEETIQVLQIHSTYIGSRLRIHIDRTICNAFARSNNLFYACRQLVYNRRQSKHKRILVRVAERTLSDSLTYNISVLAFQDRRHIGIVERERSKPIA